MILTAFGLFFGIPFMTDVFKSLAKYGYQKLKDKNEIYKILADHGIEEPTDNDRSLYVHSLALLNAQMNDIDYFEILITDESFAVFRNSYIESEKIEPFTVHINRELLRRIGKQDDQDVFKARSQQISESFIRIYNDLLKQIASPLQSKVLNSLENNEKGIALILQKMEAKQSDSDFVKRQIKIATSFLEERKFSSGISILQSLVENLHEIKSIDLKSNVLVNIGYAYTELGEKEEAKKYFKRAFEINENNYAALCNYSQTLISEGELEIGRKLIQRAVDLYGGKINDVWEAFILVNQRTVPIHDLIEQLPSSYSTVPGILRALAIAYRLQGSDKEYLNHIAKAYQLSPSDPGVRLTYFESIIHKYQTDYKIYNIRSIGSDLKLEMEDYLGQIEVIIESEQEATISKLFYFQAKLVLLYLLYRAEEALEFFDVVEKEFSLYKNRLYQLKAMLLFVNAKSKEAISLLKRFFYSSELPEDCLMMIDIGTRSDESEIVEEAFERISKTSDSDLIYQGILMLVDYYISKENKEKIAFWKEQIKNYTGLEFRIIEAKILFYYKSSDFLSFLDKCKQQVNSGTRFSVVNGLIDLYEKMEAWDSVVELLESRLPDLDYNLLTDRLLTALEKKGDINKLVEKLEQLRIDKGIHQKYTIRECNLYIENYQFEKAVRISKEYTKHFKDRIDVEMSTVITQYRIGEYSDVDQFLEREIEFDKLHKGDQNNYLVLLAGRGKLLKCLEIIYEFHNKYNTPYSNDLYIGFWIKYNLRSLVTQPSKAEVNSVIVISDGIREKRTLLIVDKAPENIQLHQNEVELDSDISKLILGKNVGDEFIWNEGLVQKKWMIDFIESRYTFQYTKCSENAGGIFKNEVGFKAYHIEDVIAASQLPRENSMSENPSGTLFDYYNDMEIGIGTISEVFNLPIPNTRIKLIAGNHNLIASLGVKDQLRRAELNSDTEIVFDITGILTLFDLGLVELVTEQFENLSITHSTLEELRNFFQESTFGNNRHDLSNYPLLDLISKHFRIKNPNVIAINGNRKKAMYKTFGTSMYDSAILASESNSILYSDDCFSRTRSNNNTNTCWTIPFLKYLLHTNVIDNNFYQQKILTLLKLKYKFIDVSSKTLYYCLEKNDFKITDEFILPLYMLTGKISSLESVLINFLELVILLISSRRYSETELLAITNLVLSYVVIERDLAEITYKYEILISKRVKTNEDYTMLKQILNVFFDQYH